MKSKIQNWFFFNDHKKEHVRSLDGLRGIAVIMVLLSHSSNNSIYFHEVLAFNGIGKSGVYLFFVLSAYLLDRQISLALMNQQADSFFWLRYFIRRFLRIYPLLIVSLVVFWIFSFMGVTTTILNSTDILKHIFLLEGKGVFWSIPVEFKYYVLSPFILLVCHRYLKWDIRKITVFFMIISAMMLTIDTLIELNKISTFKYLLVFLTGTYLAVVNIFVKTPKWISGWGKIIGIMGFAALILCVVMTPLYMGDWMGINNENNGRKLMIIYAFLCGVMLFSALYDQGPFKGFLENKVLRFTGVISFSLYLFHMPVLQFMNKDIIKMPDFFKIYFFLGSTFLLSVVTYLLVERPLSRIIIYKRPPLTKGPV